MKVAGVISILGVPSSVSASDDWAAFMVRIGNLIKTLYSVISLYNEYEQIIVLTDHPQETAESAGWISAGCKWN